MENETKQVLDKILDKLDKLDNTQRGMLKEQQEMKTELQKMQKEQQEMKTELQKMKKEQQKIKTTLENIETRQDEIYRIATSIEHSNQVLKAEVDNMKVKMAKAEGNFTRMKEAIR